MHTGAHKLLARLDESGPGILDFLPGALRALLRARIVGPTTPAGGTRTGVDLDAERAALLHVLVMLEVLEGEYGLYSIEPNAAIEPGTSDRISSFSVDLGDGIDRSPSQEDTC